jgi:hypothetical protein
MGDFHVISNLLFIPRKSSPKESITTAQAKQQRCDIPIYLFNDAEMLNAITTSE